MLQASHSNGGREAAGLFNVTDTARRLWLRASASRALLKLSDQTLDDIGLSRDKVRQTLMQASLRDLRRLVDRHP